MTTSILGIQDGVLLENSTEGYTITSYDWNRAMQTIKETINNHATGIIDTKVTKVVQIQEGSLTQAQSSVSNYNYEIDPKDYGFGKASIITRVYGLNGVELVGAATLNSSATGSKIKITTRVKTDLIVILQGAS